MQNNIIKLIKNKHMISVKLKFRVSSLIKNEGTLYFNLFISERLNKSQLHIISMNGNGIRILKTSLISPKYH